MGLSGKDGQLITAKKMKFVKDMGDDKPPEIIDMGMVGEIVSINNRILKSMIEDQFIPVISAEPVLFIMNKVFPIFPEYEVLISETSNVPKFRECRPE